MLGKVKSAGIERHNTNKVAVKIITIADQDRCGFVDV
jgi:hypothetical protein